MIHNYFNYHNHSYFSTLRRPFVLLDHIHFAKSATRFEIPVAKNMSQINHNIYSLNPTVTQKTRTTTTCMRDVPLATTLASLA